MDSYTVTWHDELTRPNPPAFNRSTAAVDYHLHTLTMYAETSGAPDRRVRSLVRALKACEGISEVKVTLTRETEEAVEF